MDESIYLFIKGKLAKNDGSIALIPVGDLEKPVLEKLDKVFSQNIGKRDFVITNDLIKATQCSELIILIEEGTTKRKQLFDISKKLGLQEKPVLGLLVIIDSSEEV